MPMVPKANLQPFWFISLPLALLLLVTPLLRMEVGVRLLMVLLLLLDPPMGVEGDL